MKNWIFFGIIVAAGLAQVAILDSISIFGVKPDLLLICCIYASLFFEFKRAIALSIFAGILKDALAMNTFGVNTLLFALLSLAIIKLSREVSLDNNPVLIVAVFIIAFISAITIRLIFFFMGNFISCGILLRTVSLEALYTALVFPLALKVTRAALRC
ncbi:MAG: rod shape-determining protein MreD [Candidatus Omnitrophota bacterium]